MSPISTYAAEVAQRATIIGAGAIGVATALQLQQRGYPVTLIDRSEPAEGCSSGNAGILAAYGVAPLSLPGILNKVPGMLLDPQGPLSIRRQHLLKIAPWLWRFWRASRPERVEEIATALGALLGDTVARYQALTDGTAATALIKPSPVLCVYENEQAYKRDSFVWDLRRRHGVRWRLLQGPELHDIEPTVSPHFQYAAAFEQCGFTLNPQRLIQILFETFIRNGGKFVRADVQDIQMGERGPTHLLTSTGKQAVQQLVIASGAWSGQLSRRLGEPVPLEAERGYHVTLSAFDGRAPSHPIMSPSQKVIATPMEMGLRIAGMVEFGGFMPPDYRRSSTLRDLLGALFPGIKAGTVSPWMGHRPSLPDSLPVIGASSRHPSVFYAFGHHHVGLTAAPMTGRLIADLVTGQTPAIDLSAFRVNRFK